MNIIGQNLKLRRLPPAEWAPLEQSMRKDLSAVGGIRLCSLQPGLMEIEVEGRNARDLRTTLDRIRSKWPDWRFSEGAAYQLSAPVSLTVLP